ncbi:MAG: class I SAM-dependent methyltransferase [Candidatus Dormibacteraceae bacterium]
MEEEKPRSRETLPHAGWVVPIAAVAVGITLAALVEARRRARRRGAWRRSLRSPFRVDTVPGELLRIGVAPGLSILEVGCGAGAYLEEAARTAGRGGEARGLEPDREQADLARDRLRAQGLKVAIETAPVDRLPYADQEFDLAYLVGQMGRLRDHEAALGEVRRVLKPGGRLAVTEHFAEPGYVPASIVRRSCVAAGFEVADSHDGPWDHTSAFRRPPLA